jgi:hypothetical protein
MMGLAVACSSAALTGARRARLSVVKRPLAPSFLEDFEIMGDQGRPWAGNSEIRPPNYSGINDTGNSRRGRHSDVVISALAFQAGSEVWNCPQF